MRSIAALLLCCFLFTGCAQKDTSVSEGLELRKELYAAENSSFNCIITADYGDQIYEFAMDCSFDRNREMRFTVTEPATISGISGVMDSSGGRFTFDGNVLLFPQLADGNLSPVSAPWILMQTLCGGYLHSGGIWEGGTQLVYHDSFQGDPIQVNLFLKDTEPCAAEIIWQGRRILLLQLSEFDRQ